MRLSSKKIKVFTKNETQWNNAVRKAINEGAFSRDGDLSFNEDKEALVIDHGAIKSSRPDFIPEKAPYDQTLSYGQWMNSGSKFCELEVDDSEYDDGCDEVAFVSALKGFSAGLAAAVNPKGLTDYLVPTDIQTMTQNSVIWKTKGLPFLISQGVQLTQDGDTFYVVDTKANTAEEVTPKWAIDKGIADLVEGNTSAFTKFIHEFQLVTEVTLKVAVDETPSV